MPVIEILREDEWTVDGRSILKATWDDNPVVVMKRSETGHAHVVVGWLSGFHREGNRIYAYTDLDVECITVDVDQVEIDVPVDEMGQLIITSGRISCGYVNEKQFYPWRDAEE